MTLSSLIRKGGLASPATATPATVATQEAMKAGTVTQVATVAVANQPKPPPPPVMKPVEETAIRAWLAHIEETDPDIITEVLNRCRAEKNGRAYFLRRAIEMPRPLPDDDDRQHCAQCANLATSGVCLAARRGEIIAFSFYHPVDHIPRRCEGYAPKIDNPKPVTGSETPTPFLTK